MLWGLFISAFVAASIFPAQSELFLAGALAKHAASVWAIIGAASLGNTLGSATNWLLGRFFVHYHDRAWFPITAQKLARAEGWYRKHGRWSLLLSWMPVIGDPLPWRQACCANLFRPFSLLSPSQKQRDTLLLQ